MKLSQALKFVIFLLIVLLPVIVILLTKSEAINNLFFRPRNTQRTDENDAPAIEVVAKNLDVPWDIVFLPDRSMLVTERNGSLLHIDDETKLVEKIEEVEQTSEGGLMGLALHPQFKDNRYIYIFMTTMDINQELKNEVVRYKYDGESITDKTLILSGIEGGENHDGGRIRFGPDGYLYVTTGDAGNENLAQNKGLLNGKILRVTDEGEIPEDNPFKNPVYSYGHRNSQGIAWDDNRRLWSTEHGPSGFETGFDEINLIEKGANYGWPLIKGSEEQGGKKTPLIQSGSEDTWAPAGAAIIGDNLYFTGLRGEALYRLTINNDGTVSDLKTFFKSEYGRLRAITVGPDGLLYISTSNRDGRGNPNTDDDMILRINADKL